MAQNCKSAGWRGLAFVAVEISPSENGERSQWPELRRNALHSSNDERSSRRQPPALQLASRVKSARNAKIHQRRAQKLGRHLEQSHAPPQRRFGFHGLPQQREIPLFQASQLRSADSPREQFGRRGLQSRLRRHLAFVKLGQPFPPPGKLDRTKRRLRRLADDIRHRIVDCEECVEGRPQFRRPIAADEGSVRRLSDSRRPSPPRPPRTP